jgi:hypothetical protein
MTLANFEQIAANFATPKALVLPVFGQSDNIDRAYKCLYGKPQDEVPMGLIFWGLFHSLFSAVMIFFMLLVLRNHFRIH